MICSQVVHCIGAVSSLPSLSREVEMLDADARCFDLGHETGNMMAINPGEWSPENAHRRVRLGTNMCPFQAD